MLLIILFDQTHQFLIVMCLMKNLIIVQEIVWFLHLYCRFLLWLLKLLVCLCGCWVQQERIFSVYLGAVLSHSTAIAMDAAHMCIDSGSFLISLAAIYLARKRPTRRLSYGYARAGTVNITYFHVKICWSFSIEILGALISVLTIWVATGILVYIAARRVVNQNFTVKPNEMVIVAALGVVFNIV